MLLLLLLLQVVVAVVCSWRRWIALRPLLLLVVFLPFFHFLPCVGGWSVGTDAAFSSIVGVTLAFVGGRFTVVLLIASCGAAVSCCVSALASAVVGAGGVVSFVGAFFFFFVRFVGLLVSPTGSAGLASAGGGRAVGFSSLASAPTAYPSVGDGFLFLFRLRFGCMGWSVVAWVGSGLRSTAAFDSAVGLAAAGFFGGIVRSLAVAVAVAGAV